MKYTIAFPAGLTAAVLLLCTGCAATQVRDRAYLQAIELRFPDTPTVLLHDFHESKAIAYGKGSSVSQAVANAAVPVGKTLFLGHLELIAYETPAFGEQLDDLMQQYRLSPACKVACSADGITLAQEDTTKTVEQLRQAEHAGQLPETDLFTILREWDTASGTALVPLMTEDGFSAAIATKTNLSAALSPDAVSGLCWLRGDNYPEQFSTESGSYTVSSAKTQLSAEKLPDGFHITAAIFLEGEGDFEAASQEITRLCQAAFQETVSEYHADVFDVEPCLWSQCYKDMEQSDWKTAAGQMHFSVQVNPHKNML